MIMMIMILCFAFLVLFPVLVRVLGHIHMAKYCETCGLIGKIICRQERMIEHKSRHRIHPHNTYISGNICFLTFRRAGSQRTGTKLGNPLVQPQNPRDAVPTRT